MHTTTIDEIALADRPDPWAACGFAVSDDACEVGAVRLRFAGAAGAGELPGADSAVAAPAAAAGSAAPIGLRAGDNTPPGILGWSLRGIDGAALSAQGELDGLPTRFSHAAAREPAPAQPNGVVAIDHVVAMTPSFERSVAALQAAGLDLRRVREQPTPAGAPRQAFFRLGAEILELVQEPDEVVQRAGGRDRPARFWGLAFVVADIERTAAQMAPHVGEVRAAVQTGRRIATVRRSAGLCVPVALMSARGDEQGGERAASGRAGAPASGRAGARAVERAGGGEAAPR